jgi:predicted amidohydrolase
LIKKYTIALIQLNTQDNFEANLEAIKKYVDEAASAGAKLASFPEVMNFIGERNGPIVHLPEGEDGPTFTLLSSLAKKYGVYIHGGSWAEKKEGDKKFYNTTWLFSPEGAAIARYRKIHTFDIVLPDGTATLESDRVAKGDKIVTAETELGVLGFTICYDLRFPELFRLLTLRGAQVIFVPANFTTPTGKDHWEPLIRARAIENSCYVAATGQWGKNARTLAFGNSMLADPWGTVVARGRESPGVTLGQVDLDYCAAVREKMQTLQNLRPDVYRLEEVR